MKIFLLLLAVTIASVSFGQSYKFQKFTQNSGLNDPFIYGISQDSRGYLVVGTGGGLALFDGVSFEMKYIQDGLAEDFVSTIHKSRSGIVWIGHNQGGISLMNNGNISEFESKLKFESKITDIAESSNGSVWFCSQREGIISYNLVSKKEQQFTKSFADDKIVNSIAVTENNTVLVATANGLEEYVINDLGTELLFKKRYFEDESTIKVRSLGRDDYVIATSDGVVYRFNSNSKETEEIKSIPEMLSITNLYVDDRESIYLTTVGDGLIKINTQKDVVSVYNKSNGLEKEDLKTCFVDREGTLWLGSFGEGIYKHNQEIFTYYLAKNDVKKMEISALCEHDNFAFFANKNRVFIVENNNFQSKDTIVLNSGVTINALHYLDGRLWIGTSENGLMIFNSRTSEIDQISLSNDKLTSTITDITHEGSSIWAGTLNGLFSINPKNGQIRKYDISSGLSHNTINTIFYDPLDKRLLVGSKSAELNIIENNLVSSVPFNDDGRVVYSFDIAQLRDGRIAVASYGDGVYVLEGETMLNIGLDQGLESKFCYSLIEDGKENIWVTHNGALSKFSLADSTVKVYGEQDGVNLRFLKSSAIATGTGLWFGSEQGVLKYDPFIDGINLAPPVLSMQEIRLDGEIVEESNLEELQAKSYDLQFIIKGLSLRNPKNVQYQYKLEGYDERWSDISQQNHIKFPKVSDGDYKLIIKAYNHDMVASKEQVLIEFTVPTPIWKQMWFWLVLFVAFVSLILWVIKRRENNLRMRQIHLEKELGKRTKELVEHQTELEASNKDITDSINYAKRIQDAMLPDDSFVDNVFNEIFVIYRPRDIVSGDFYWVNKVNNKSYIVCGDCTGHGVPGAFLTLIGQQILKESFGVKKISNPSIMIQELDEEIKYLIHSSNDGSVQTSDGMDVIMAEFDHENNKMNWASAMRPLVWYRDGKRNYERGTRSSVGSAPDETLFDLQSIDSQKGDVFYFFSDGFPDQFGGPKKKKMKISKLLSTLDKVNSLPIDIQKSELSSMLDNWQGDVHQTDDIILIGVRI